MCWCHSEYFLYINPVSAHSNDIGFVLTLLPYYQWVKQGTDRLINLPQVTQLVIARAGTQTQQADFRVCAPHHYTLLFLMVRGGKAN